jgi:hypothetical protein
VFKRAWALVDLQWLACSELLRFLRAMEPEMMVPENRVVGMGIH